MRNPFIRTIWRERRGSMLAVTMVVMTLATVSTLVMATSAIDHKRLGDRRFELSKAFYMAEAGVAMVVQWSNDPASYTPNRNLFRRDPMTGEFIWLEAALGMSDDGDDIGPIGGGEETPDGIDADRQGLTTYHVPESMLVTLTSAADFEMGSVASLAIIPPAASDPIPSLFKIRSTGVSPSGITRTVVYFANPNPILNIPLPAAVISIAGASASGNARIHWGEAWAKGDFAMLNKSQMNYLLTEAEDHDPWARYRSEGQITFPANWQWGLDGDLYDPARVNPGEAPASGDYADAFEQHVSPGVLDFPDFGSEYQAFKNLALTRGRYYSTSATGTIYRDGIEDAEHAIDFMSEFAFPDRHVEPYDFVFIDTIDGNPPAADGSNLATITASGSSAGLKGVFYIAANFDASGVGSPPSLNAMNPDGEVSALSQIFLDGVIYSAGSLALSGNAGVFGSVIAEGGITGGGTPDVYYNAALRNGIPIPIASQLTLALWRNF